MIQNTARHNYTSVPAKSTTDASKKNIKKFDKWLMETPSPYVHPNITIEGISTWAGGSDDICAASHFELNKHLYAYHRILLPEQDRWYDLMAECIDKNGKFHPERCDRDIIYYTAESYKVQSSSLVAGLKRKMEEIHKQYVENHNQGEIPLRWQSVPDIRIGEGQYRLTHTVRHKMIKYLWEREEYFAEDEEGNRKTQRPNRNTIAPGALSKIHKNIGILLQKPINPIDLLCWCLYWQLLERFERGGRELRKYEMCHYKRMKDGEKVFYRITWPRGTKNNKYKNRNNKQLVYYDVDEGHPLFIGLDHYFMTRGDHVTNAAFYLQWHDTFRVKFALLHSHYDRKPLVLL